MSDRDLHLIDDDLSDGWIDGWIDDVLADVEDYLGKHAAFGDFLAADE